MFIDWPKWNTFVHFMSTSTCTHVKLCMTCSAKVKLLLFIYFCRVLNNKRKAEMSNLLDTTSTRTTGPTLAPAVSTTESDQIASRSSFSNPRPTLAMNSFDQHNQSMNLNPTDVFHSTFYGSTINGGTFNININFGDDNAKRSKSKWKLCVLTVTLFQYLCVNLTYLLF